jgi:hypothetical protein
MEFFLALEIDAEMKNVERVLQSNLDVDHVPLLKVEVSLWSKLKMRGNLETVGFWDLKFDS